MLAENNVDKLQEDPTVVTKKQKVRNFTPSPRTTPTRSSPRTRHSRRRRWASVIGKSATVPAQADSENAPVENAAEKPAQNDEKPTETDETTAEKNETTVEATETEPKEEAEMEVTDSAAGNPENEKPETEKPETEKPETEKPETEKPENDKPETEGAEPEVVEAAEPETKDAPTTA